MITKNKSKIDIRQLWCWLCKVKREHKWVPEKGAGIANGRYRCVICDSMYYG